MRNVRIEAASLESARGIEEALEGFVRDLVAENGRCWVEITLTGGDREIVRLLNALEKHVTSRAAGPAKIELDGKSYTMEAPGH